MSQQLCKPSSYAEINESQNQTLLMLTRALSLQKSQQIFGKYVDVGMKRQGGAAHDINVSNHSIFPPQEISLPTRQHTFNPTTAASHQVHSV